MQETKSNNLTELVFNEHKKRMWYTANKICDDALDAENAVHDALFAISQKPDHIDSNNISDSVLNETVKVAAAIAKKTMSGKTKKAVLKKAAEFNISSVPEETEIEYTFSRRFLESFENPQAPKARPKSANKTKVKKAIIATIVMVIIATACAGKYVSYSKTVVDPAYGILVNLTSLIYGNKLNKVTDPGKYELSYLPEGFKKTDYSEQGSRRIHTYKNPETNQLIEFTQYVKAINLNIKLTFADSDTVTIDSTEVGIYYMDKEGQWSIAWEDKNYLYEIYCSPELEPESLLSNVGNLIIVE